jgi:hypothetical protein
MATLSVLSANVATFYHNLAVSLDSVRITVPSFCSSAIHLAIFWRIYCILSYGKISSRARIIRSLRPANEFDVMGLPTEL